MMPAADTQISGLLPNFCDVRVIFMLVLIVELLAIVLAMMIPATTAAFWDHLAFISMLLQWIALIDAAKSKWKQQLFPKISGEPDFIPLPQI